MYYLEFIKKSLLINLKISVTRKLSFILSLMTVALIQGAFLFCWKTFFNKYTSVGGWVYSHFLLLHGLMSTSLGISELFFFGLRDMPKIIESGQIDILLVQPKSIILKIAMSKNHFLAIGEIIIGLVTGSCSGYLLKYPFKFSIIVLLASLFVVSLYIYLGSIIFYFKGAGDIIKDLRSTSQICASQPNSGFKGIIKLITYTLLPVSYWSFFPIEFFRTNNIKYFLITLIGTVLFFMVALLCCSLGIKKYESGNNNVIRY